MPELLQQVRVLDPLSGRDRVADVLIDTAQIRIISPQIDEFPPETKVTAAQGLILAPGLVDLYSHSGEPGHEERETLDSLTRAAIAGGFTRLHLLPDTTPSLDQPGVVEQLRRTPTCPGFWGIWGALTPGLQGQGLVEFADLKDLVVGFADGCAIANWALLYRLLEYLAPLQKPIALVPAVPSLQQGGVVRADPRALQLGLPGDPACSEAAAIATILELVASLGTPVHLMKISTARGVELIAQAKERQLPITASVTWLHLLWEIGAVGNYHTSLRLAPPLGTAADRAALIDGVKTGVIDAIAIDHTPRTYEEKTVSFVDAPPGAIGLEFALPFLWANLIDRGIFDPLELWQALSTAPAHCLGQTPSQCVDNAALECILFDPQASWEINAQTLNSRSRNTHLWGEKVTGKVQRVFLASTV